MAEKPEPCSEPDGNERIYVDWDNVDEAAIGRPDAESIRRAGTDGVAYAHDVMIEAAGQCPWCGREN